MVQINGFWWELGAWECGKLQREFEEEIKFKNFIWRCEANTQLHPTNFNVGWELASDHQLCTLSAPDEEFSQQTLTYTLPTSMLDESLLLTINYTICTWWRVQSVQRDLAIVAWTRSLWFNSQRLPAFHIPKFFFRHNKDILYRIQFTFFLMFINWKMSGIVEESTSSARYEKSNLWGCRNVQTISTLMYVYGNSHNRMFTWFETN